MPQPEGAELQSIRERRASLRDTTFAPQGSVRRLPPAASTTSR
jgi:hypothetical protein